MDKFGKLHVLFSNAGMGVGGPIKNASFNDWDWGTGVMIGGVVNGLTLALPYILQHGEGGHILTTSSMSAVVPIPGATIYTTCKAAVVGMMESIRGELAGRQHRRLRLLPRPGAIEHPRERQDPSREVTERDLRIRRPRTPARPAASQSLVDDKLRMRPAHPQWHRRNDLYILTHPSSSRARASTTRRSCRPSRREDQRRTGQGHRLPARQPDLPRHHQAEPREPRLMAVVGNPSPWRGEGAGVGVAPSSASLRA